MPFKNADVRRLNSDRENIDVDEAKSLFLHHDVLRADDGIKLCVFIALNKLPSDVVYDLYGEMVVNRAKGQDHLHRIGRFLTILYDRAPDEGLEESQNLEAKITKQSLANLFVEMVDYITIVRDREVAERFSVVFKSAVEDPKPDFSEMLFTATMRIWSRIDSPNDHISWGAYYIQQCIYPPRCSDKIQQGVYEEKHQKAFISAFRHPSVPIRLQALEGAVEKAVFWWDDFQKVYRSQIMEELVKLTKDSQAEVRAAVFKCLRFFALNPSATTKAVDELLPKICKDGIDDVKEKVRQNCVRAMGFFVDKGNISFDRFIDFKVLCHRLDFEENEMVEQALVKLIKTSSPADYGLPLQKFVRKFVRASRNAALDYHRLLFGCGQIKIEEALKYIEALVGFINPFLEKKEEYAEEDALENFNAKVDIIKDVFDCAIVLYATIQPTAAATDNSRIRTDLSTVNRLFSEIVATIFDQFETHQGLMDSTLTLASLSPNTVRFYPKFFHQVEREVRGGKIVERHIQAFAMNDMNKLTHLLLEGLTQVQMSSQRIASKNAPTPAKQMRPSIFLNELAVIDALTSLLENPTTSSYLINEYDYFVSQFVEKLIQTRDNFMLAKRNGRSSKDLPDALFSRTTDTIAVLRILTYDKRIKKEVKEEEDTQRRNKRGRRARTAEPDEASQSAEADSDPLLYEVDWIETQFELDPKTICHSEIAEVLYNALGLYIRSHPHKEPTIQKVIATTTKIHTYAIENPQRGDRSAITAYNECQKRAKHALDLMTPKEPRPQIPTIREEDEEAASGCETESNVEMDEKVETDEPSAIFNTTIKSEVPHDHCGEFSTLHDNIENEQPADSKLANDSDLNGTLVEET